MAHPDHAWLLDAVADPAHGWAVGTFGAIAEFTRDPDEAASCDRSGDGAGVATARGGFRLTPPAALRPVAYETPNRDGVTWSQAVALCLPAGEAASHRRSVLTEIGPDAEAIRQEDRGAILFDMGLGTMPVDVCIRTRDPALLATLLGGVGRSLFEPGNPVMGAIVAAGPHRVFLTRAGRGEVYQPIPPADGRSPDGPHTHVLPKLLRSGRTHAATTPIPGGLVPVAHLFPPNPVRDAMGRPIAFDRAAHRAFAEIFARFGDPAVARSRSEVAAAISAGQGPEVCEPTDDKHARAALRVTLRQLRAAGHGGPTLVAWSAAFDRAPPEAEPDDEDEQPSHAA